MNKLYAKNLSIEITRNCNMSCAHCMRGNAQNINIRHQYIKNVLKHFKYISCLTITGGEPSLNIEAIRYILKQLKHFHIHIYQFYIVTNGSQSSISKEFIDVCSELFDYQEEKDMEENSHMLEMSDDKFHESHFHKKVITALSKYPFFGLRGQAENIFLFKEGRSTVGNESRIYPIYLNAENYVYGNVYLNAEGMIISNGDLSYQRQKQNELCHSGSFGSFIKSTVRTE